MAYFNGHMYCVSSKGGLYELVDYNNTNPTDNYALKPYPFTAAEIAADPKGPATIISAGIGVCAQLTYIGTIKDVNNKPVPLSGLSDGPPDVEGGKYAGLLFATDSSGEATPWIRPSPRIIRRSTRRASCSRSSTTAIPTCRSPTSTAAI